MAETPKKAAPLSSSIESILNDCSLLAPSGSDAPKMSFNKDITAHYIDSSNNLLSLAEDSELDAIKEQPSSQVTSNTENSITNVTKTTTDVTTNYWNYDELNELRIKFTSLLSPDKEELKREIIQSDITRGCGVASKLVRFVQSISFRTCEKVTVIISIFSLSMSLFLHEIANNFLK